MVALHMLILSPPLEPRQRQVCSRSTSVAASSAERRHTDEGDSGRHAGAGDVALVGGLGRLLGDGGGLAHGQGVRGDDAGAASQSEGLRVLGDDLAGGEGARHDAGVGSRAHGNVHRGYLGRGGGFSALYRGRGGNGGGEDLVAESNGEDRLDGNFRGNCLVDG